ncbi:MAG: SIMPL domain-containing protein [Chloroflexi bacterium]|nr:SIMPL domain-containing protein [Chloroflexota bacterium]
MTRTLGKSGGIFFLIGLGLVVMVLLACTSRAAAPVNSGSPTGAASDQTSVAGGLTPAQGQASGQERAFIAGAAQAGIPVSQRTGIMVNGRGTASAAPDMAILNLGVEAFAPSVAEARNSAAVAMGRVTDVLQARGIAGRDIQTRFFNISPRYTTRQVLRCPDTKTTSRSVAPALPLVTAIASEPSRQGVPEGPVVEIARSQPKPECFEERERVITGFQVSNQLTVNLRDMDAIGEVIDEVTEGGGDLIRFQGISFTIENPDSLQDQALSAAIEDVLAKADQVASLTGVQLGRLVHITETSGRPGVPALRLESAAFAVKSAPTSIQTGELDVVVTVQALFAIE